METNNLLLFFFVEWGSRKSASIPREIELSRSKSSRRRTITIYHESVCCRGGNVCWVFRITQGAVVSTVCAPGICYQLQKVDKMTIWTDQQRKTPKIWNICKIWNMKKETIFTTLRKLYPWLKRLTPIHRLFPIRKYATIYNTYNTFHTDFSINQDPECTNVPSN